MKITNDIVSFDAMDVEVFSESVRAALELTAGENRTPEQFLSQAVNCAIAAAQRSRVNGLLESMRPAAEKLAGLSDVGARDAIGEMAQVADVANPN